MVSETTLSQQDQGEDQASHTGGSKTQPTWEDAQEPLIAQTGDTKTKSPTQDKSRCLSLSVQ